MDAPRVHQLQLRGVFRISPGRSRHHQRGGATSARCFTWASFAPSHWGWNYCPRYWVQNRDSSPQVGGQFHVRRRLLVGELSAIGFGFYIENNGIDDLTGSATVLVLQSVARNCSLAGLLLRLKSCVCC